MAQTTIRVQYGSNGRPAAGYRVVLNFTGGLGSISRAVLTDDQGRATIDHSTVGPAEVIVQGATRMTVRCPGEYTVTV